MLKKLYKAIKRDGVIGFINYAAGRIHLKRKVIHFIYGPISIPIALIVLSISRWLPIRLILLFSNRIGHYPYNTELLLCVLDQSPEKNKIKTIYYTVPGMPICNKQMHKMWERVIQI